jgi:hypothetical protein
MRAFLRMSTSTFALALLSAPVAAMPFSFSTGDPDGKMATASRPDSSGKIEIESADDFVLTEQTSITGATFTGLLTGNATVGDVRVEIYRVFLMTRISGGRVGHRHSRHPRCRPESIRLRMSNSPIAIRPAAVLPSRPTCSQVASPRPTPCNPSASIRNRARRRAEVGRSSARKCNSTWTSFSLSIFPPVTTSSYLKWRSRIRAAISLAVGAETDRFVGHPLSGRVC